MRWTKQLAITSVTLALAGCETSPRQEALEPSSVAVAPTPAPDEMVWIRTDGQRGAGNPDLQTQFEIDAAACPGAEQRSPAAVPCMREYGYILVPDSEAESLLQDFARASGYGEPF